MEDVPDEVLEIIFFNLSPKMIKICTLVSKRWNWVIENSREIMNHFILNLEDRNEMEIEIARKLKRMLFHSLKCCEVTPAVKEIILKYKLRDLQITNCSINATDLNDCLEQLIYLETFIGQHVRIKEKYRLRRIKFSNLKVLRVQYSDIELILMFDVESLEELEISPSSKEERGSALLQIIKRQINLKRLSVGGYFSDSFLNLHGIYEFGIGNIEHFRFERSPLGETPDKCLIKFLNIHQKTLNSLELIYPFNVSVFIYINNIMTNISYLNIPVNELSEMSDINFRELSENISIKSIRFVGNFTTLSRANDIFDLFPSLLSIDVGDLTTPTYFMQILLHLALTKCQLKVLKIPNLLHNYNNNIYFPSLKEFFVKRAFNQDHYNAFIYRHMDTLESITIGSFDCDYLKGLVIDQITACPNIKYISIAAKTSVVLKKFDELASKNKEWKLLVNLKGHSGLKFVVLKFNFPQDRILFQDKIIVHSEEYIKKINILDDMGLNRFANKYK